MWERSAVYFKVKILCQLFYILTQWFFIDTKAKAHIILRVYLSEKQMKWQLYKH